MQVEAFTTIFILHLVHAQINCFQNKAFVNPRVLLINEDTTSEEDEFIPPYIPHPTILHDKNIKRIKLKLGIRPVNNKKQLFYYNNDYYREPPNWSPPSQHHSSHKQPTYQQPPHQPSPHKPSPHQHQPHQPSPYQHPLYQPSPYQPSPHQPSPHKPSPHQHQSHQPSSHQHPPYQQKLNVTIFYESLCPNSNRFIMQQLYPTFMRLGRYFEVDFVPFGYAKEVNGVFECQHGPKECVGNIVAACMLERLETTASKVEFIHCQHRNFRPEVDGPYCAYQMGIDYRPVQECIQGEEGYNLIKGHGDRTVNFEPPIMWLPNVVINNVFSFENEQMALEDFHGLICKNIEGHKPSTCRRFTPWQSPYKVDIKKPKDKSTRPNYKGTRPKNKNKYLKHKIQVILNNFKNLGEKNNTRSKLGNYIFQLLKVLNG